MPDMSYQAAWCQAVNAATGARFSICVGAGAAGGGGSASDVASIVSDATSSSASGGGGWLQWVEGSDEPNTYSVTISVTDQVQQELWSGVSGTSSATYPVTIVGPSIAFTLPKPETTIQAFAASSDISTLKSNSSACNVHFYPVSNPDADDSSGRSGAMHDVSTGMAAVYGSQPILCTEWHSTLKNTQGASPSTLQASYDPYYATIFCLGAFREGWQGWFWRSLFDFGSTQCGLFPTNATNPRNVAYALRALYALTGDPSSSTKHSFTPGKLNVTITGLPASLTNAPYTGGQTALFQNSSGTFFLFVWNSQTAPGGTASQITLTFPTAMTSVSEYNLTDSPASNMTPVQSLTSVKSLTSSLDASVHLFVIQYPGTATPWIGTLESKEGATVTAQGQTINASQSIGNPSGGPYDTWTITGAGGQVVRNGTTDTTTAAIIELYYHNHTVYQESSNGNELGITPGWWSWNGSGWTASQSPVPQITGISLSNTSLTPPSGGTTVPSGTSVGSVSVAMQNGTFTGQLSIPSQYQANFSLSGSSLLTASALSTSGSPYSVALTATQPSVVNSPYTSSPISIYVGSNSGTGPAATSTFVTVEFSTTVNMPKNLGPVVIPREMFGVATAAGCDNDFLIMTQSGFQAASRSLTIPLLRFNPNSGLCAVWQNTFPNGPNGTPDFSGWNNFINNVGKCVDLANCKIVIGAGWPSSGGTGGYSDSDFAHMSSLVCQHLATTAPSGGGSPINPLYWEYLNEQGSTSSSGFNAFYDAINSVGSGYTILGPTSADTFSQLSTLVSGAGGRNFIGDVHDYLYCGGNGNPDQKPSDQQMAQGQTASGSVRCLGFASNINSALDGNIPYTYPFFKGEYNLECGAVSTAEEQNIVCAMFAASDLFKCASAINRPLWAGLWEWVNDNTYGMIQQVNGNAIVPVGYFLSRAAQKMPGTMVSSTLNGSNAPNMAGWSTKSATAGNFGIYLHNWDSVAHSGSIALSHVPASPNINNSGNGTVTVWTQSGSTPTGGSTSTVTVTNGVTAPITVPSMGQVIISVP